MKTKLILTLLAITSIASVLSFSGDPQTSALSAEQLECQATYPDSDVLYMTTPEPGCYQVLTVEVDSEVSDRECPDGYIVSQDGELCEDYLLATEVRDVADVSSVPSTIVDVPTLDIFVCEAGSALDANEDANTQCEVISSASAVFTVDDVTANASTTQAVPTLDVYECATDYLALDANADVDTDCRKVTAAEDVFEDANVSSTATTTQAQTSYDVYACAAGYDATDANEDIDTDCQKISAAADASYYNECDTTFTFAWTGSDDTCSNSHNRPQDRDNCATVHNSNWSGTTDTCTANQAIEQEFEGCSDTFSADWSGSADTC